MLRDNSRSSSVRREGGKGKGRRGRGEQATDRMKGDRMVGGDQGRLLLLGQLSGSLWILIHSSVKGSGQSNQLTGVFILSHLQSKKVGCAGRTFSSLNFQLLVPECITVTVGETNDQ